MAIEICPHCDSSVLFTGETCPACGKNKNDSIDEKFKQSKIDQQRKRIRVLSSKKTLYYRIVYPILLILALLFFVFGILKNINNVKIFLLNPYTGAVFFFFILLFIVYFYLFSKLKYIKFDDQCFHLSNYLKYKEIPFDKIIEIRKIGWVSLITRSDFYHTSFESSKNQHEDFYFIRKDDGAKDNTSSAINAFLKKLSKAKINI